MSLQVLVRDAVKKSLSTTPGTMTAMQISILVTTVLFFLAIWCGVDNHRMALNIVCHDSAPSIVAAQNIKAELADLDADAANELLVPSGQNPEATEGYVQRRAQITDNLITAAQNITYGDAEKKPIEAIENGLSLYEAEITRARSHHQANDAAFLQDYLKATYVMHGPDILRGDQGLLHQSDLLDAANDQVLKTTYNDQRFWSTVTVVVVFFTGGLMLFCLARAQLFLSFKMHRTLNQGLLGATVLGALLLAGSGSKLMDSGRDLKWAKEDAFDSVSALIRARAEAYDANGAESRWLLARNMNSSSAESFDQEFTTKTHAIATVSGNSYAQVADACKGTKETLPPGFHGLLADELGNVTFDGELGAAQSMLKTWGQYMDVDKQIRDLEKRGQHDDAVRLCCGSQPGQSNYVFAQFDGEDSKTGLGKTLDINQQEFDKAYATGLDTLAHFEWIAAVCAAGICALTLWGFRERFNEYRMR